MISTWKSCCSRVPQRWVFAVMGVLAILNAYNMRVCLSITITEMTEAENKTHINADNICSIPDANKKNVTEDNTSGAKRYQWKGLTGIILSSFYWGYVVTHLPGGILAEKFGGKYTLGLGILSTAIFTLLTPLAVEWGEATGLIIVRVLMGLGEGTTFPALNAMLAQWTPPEERSMIGSLVFGGAQIGTVSGTLISGYLLHYYSWPVVFYVFGALGVLWFIIWVLICYNNPYEHPFISEREKEYLHERMSEHTHKKPPPVPWRFMLKSLPFWALIAAQVGHDWGFFTMVNDLPTYMSSVLHYNIKENAVNSSIPYITMWISSLITSWLADWIITKGTISRTNVRKLGTTIASVGPGIFLIAASYSNCDGTLAVVMFTIGMTFMGTFYPGMKVNGLDLSPNYSGTIMAFVNGIGAITGIITPYIVTELTPEDSLSQWQLVFWIVFSVFIVTNLIFVLFASGEVQYWNDPKFVIRDKEERQNKIEGKSPEKSNKTTT